jgi:hypothetical protein
MLILFIAIGKTKPAATGVLEESGLHFRHTLKIAAFAPAIKFFPENDPIQSLTERPMNWYWSPLRRFYCSQIPVFADKQNGRLHRQRSNPVSIFQGMLLQLSRSTNKLMVLKQIYHK